LRERKTDIQLLVTFMLDKIAPMYGKSFQRVSDGAMRALMGYEWPGNDLELENLVERGFLLDPSVEQIEVEHLFAHGAPQPPRGAQVENGGLVGNVRDAERMQVYESLLDDHFDLQAHENQLLQLAVRRAGGNLTHAARLLGISRRQLAYRLKQANEGRDD
jgi:DNA-binding NtrC family response regulator